MRRLPAMIAVLVLAAAIALSAGCGEKKDEPARSEPAPGTQPVSTAPAAPAPVEVFFMKGETVFPVSREVASPGAGQALEELLRGPNDSEKQQGLTTAIPAGTRLNSYSAAKGVAKADFSAELRDYGGGSAAVLAITSQIENTVKSNDPAVSSVEITVEGVSSEEALQP